MQVRQAPPSRTSILHSGVVNPSGPHQRTSCAGSVQAPNTSARGASSVRVTTSSRFFLGAAAARFLVAATALPSCFLDVRHEAGEFIQAALPEAAIVGEPVGGVLEGAGLEAARPPLPLPPARDQTR